MSPIILAHICFAIGSVFFGYYTFFAAPTPRNVAILAASLSTVAITGFFIKTSGSFSPLHVFSVVTLVSVMLYLWSKKPFEINIRNIIGPYIGLIIAFSFTVLPSRRLGITVFEFFGTKKSAYALFFILFILSITVTIKLIKKYFVK